MKSKIFLTLMISSFLFSTQYFCKEKNEKSESKKLEKRMYVMAKGGLRMRSEPSTDSKTILTIPNNSEVVFLKETGDSMTISGSTGKWSKIKFQDKQGWVFGGFLTENIPETCNSVIIYIESNFKLLSTKNVEYDMYAQGYELSKIKKYSEGIKVSEYRGYEGGYDEIFLSKYDMKKAWNMVAKCNGLSEVYPPKEFTKKIIKHDLNGTISLKIEGDIKNPSKITFEERIGAVNTIILEPVEGGIYLKIGSEI